MEYGSGEYRWALLLYPAEAADDARMASRCSSYRLMRSHLRFLRRMKKMPAVTVVSLADMDMGEENPGHGMYSGSRRAEDGLLAIAATPPTTTPMMIRFLEAFGSGFAASDSAVY